MSRPCIVLGLLGGLLPLAATAHAQENWPQFRGARARGVAEMAAPTEWDVEKGTHIAWKTAVPGLAHSSPIVWGKRVFVTTAVRQGDEAVLSSLYGSKGYGAGESVGNEVEHAYQLFCLDKLTGEVMWKRTALKGVPKVKRHPKSSHANPTPAADSKRVLAFFGSEGLYCYDHDGDLLWKHDFGVLNSGAPGYPDKSGFQWGFASSPVLHGNRVLVQCDHEGQSFVAALDADTGDEVWRVERDENSTWCTPTVHEVAAGDRTQVIVNGYQHIGGYDLATGEQIWKLVGGGDVPVPTPVVAHDLIYLTSAHGRSRPVRAVHVTAEGELETADLAWNQPRAGIYMQTPLVHGDLLYCCSDGGILACYDAKTGKRLYRERLGSGTSGFSGSPVAAGDVLYLTGEAGEVHVVALGREFKLVTVNELGETCMSTPAVSDGTLLFRTRQHVVAVR